MSDSQAIPASAEWYAHIREDVRNAMVENRHEDPSLMPELVMYLLDELGTAARSTPEDWPITPECWAARALERCQLRAVSQIPFGEGDACAQTDYDPDWRDHR